MAPREPIITLPNLFTLARVPLAAMLWLAPASGVWLTSLVTIAGLTDVIDGRFARAMRRRKVARGEDPGKLGAADAMGAWLDPVCDKIFMLSLLAVVFVGFDVAWWIVALTATRELTVAPLWAVYRLSPWMTGKLSFEFRAGWTGKAATVAQFAVAAAIVYAPAWVEPLAIGAAVVGLLASIHYVRRAVQSARFAATQELVIDVLAQSPNRSTGA